ncbi:MAG: hypothetical protein LBQ15_03245 [Clostridium sp.]|jgi:Gpi18-like mannosyltransferase|nr:hypothetical protein [Clostridium sp.]
MYLLALISYLPMNSLYAIKAVSCLFDFAMAVLVFRWVYEETADREKAVLGYALILFAPTVWLNSSFWAQCDAGYAYFLLLAVYWLIRRKQALGMVFVGLAFCLKLQTVFLAPFLFWLWLERKLRFRFFLIIPLAYLFSAVPAILMGASPSALLTVYFEQTKSYLALSLEAANAASLIAGYYSDRMSLAFIVLTAVVLGMSVYVLYLRGKIFSTALFVSVAYYFLLCAPLFLPRMHERYFYPADVFGLLYVFFRPKKWYIPAISVSVSLLSYLPFLFGVRVVSQAHLGMLNIGAFLLLVLDIREQICGAAKRV